MDRAHVYPGHLTPCLHDAFLTNPGPQDPPCAAVALRGRELRELVDNPPPSMTLEACVRARAMLASVDEFNRLLHEWACD